MQDVPDHEKAARYVERAFERSRVDPQHLARAYELVLPIRRRSLPATGEEPASKAARFRQLAVGGSKR
jgi:hypothetical protein